jgi:DNA-binding LacI/PurR family transcriptional regulator
MKSKASHVSASIRHMIESGQFPRGSRLPSETGLAQYYAVSRPTVARALAELVDDGYVVRRVGAGTFVTSNWQTTSTLQRKNFGLLSPKLGEIFEPVSAQIASLSHSENFNLLWSTPGQSGSEASADFYITAAKRFVESGVDGVFMVPLEYYATADEANRAVVGHLEDAGVPIILIDSDICAFPERSNYDLVGIDNVRTAYVTTRHYLSQGVKRVDFVVKPYSHSTVPERIYGYQTALLHGGIAPEADWIHRGEEGDLSFVRECLDSGARNIICQNDAAAIEFMHSLSELGASIPETVRVAGFDDVRYSRLARVPLTTSKQPCEDIGRVAVEMMLRRLERRESPPVTVQLRAPLITRKSSAIPKEWKDERMRSSAERPSS